MAGDLNTLKDAVRYPWAAGDAGVTLVVGGILTLLSPLVVPGLLVLGYGLRVVEARMDGRSTPPRFGNWRDLLVDGAKGGVVLLVYVVLPLIIGGVVVSLLLGATGRHFAGPFGLRQGFAAGGLTLAGVLLLAGLALVVTYVAPAALVRLAATRRLRAAFEFDAVRRLAGADAYGAAWLLALAVFAATGVVLTVLYTVAIGVIVSGFVTFYAFVAMVYLYTQGAEAAGFEFEPIDVEADDAATSAG